MSRILVVDGDRDAREIMAHWLREDGHEVLAEEDVDRGLAHLGSGVPDLLVSDVVARDRAGLRMLATVRARHPDLPVVMVAHLTEDGEDLLHLALTLGASDTLLKPLASRRFRAAVARLVDQDPLGSGGPPGHG